MNNINNFFDSRDFFYNKHSLCDSTQAKNLLKRVTGERGGYYPLTHALLGLCSALCSYNSSLRFYTQRAVAIENFWKGINTCIRYKYTRIEENEWDGLIYTLFWFFRRQQQGQAVAIGRDLLDRRIDSKIFHQDNLPIFYDLTYLALYFSPKGRSFILLLKIGKLAYFAFRECSACSFSWDKIQTTIGKPTLANAIDLLAGGIHLYGNTLQLYTAGKAIFK